MTPIDNPPDNLRIPSSMGSSPSGSGLGLARIPAADLREFVKKAVQQRPAGLLAEYLLALSFILTFMRPQHQIGVLGAIRLPLIVSIVVGIVWLRSAKYSITTQSKIIMFFLAAEAVRIFLGRTVFEDLVRNDGWAFGTWYGLALNFFGLTIPIIAIFCSGKGLRLLFRVWLLCSLYLAMYVTTHNGFGPGGFIQDENDAGLVLLMFGALPLAVISEGRGSGHPRLLSLVAVGAVLIGVVRTFSRGTFVGLIAVAGYFFLRSSRKLLLTTLSILLVLVAVPFVPQGYWDEVRSIKNVDDPTAQGRFHLWKLATRVWMDPPHIPFGVGLGNTAYHLADYETASDTAEAASVAGRAVHSLYFQLLSELGLWGIAVIAALVAISMRRNRRSGQEIEKLIRRLESIRGVVRGAKEQPPADDEDSNRIATAQMLVRELKYLQPYFPGLNGSFVAIFSAGLFISVLYYPCIWLVACMSALLERYFTKLKLASLSLLGEERATAMLLRGK